MSMPVIKPGTVSKSQAITDLITSVGLEQTALSHILNAEGEKIQKAVNSNSPTTDEMISVNTSVESMVESITRFEIILQEKLVLFKDCLCTECPDKITD